MRCASLALVLLAGCSHSSWNASFGHPNPNATFQITGGAAVATIVGLTVVNLSDGERVGLPYLSDTQRAVPPMAPDRRVSEQDCTKPVDFTLGNIRCK